MCGTFLVRLVLSLDLTPSTTTLTTHCCLITTLHLYQLIRLACPTNDVGWLYASCGRPWHSTPANQSHLCLHCRIVLLSLLAHIVMMLLDCCVVVVVVETAGFQDFIAFLNVLHGARTSILRLDIFLVHLKLTRNVLRLINLVNLLPSNK